MKIVTYEEANKSFEKFYQKTIEGGIISKKTGRKSKLEVFLEQHKPPTWDEVVDAWEYCDYSEGYKVYQEGNVLRVYSGNELYFEADIRSLEWLWYGVWIDQLTHYAINITIRYLENKQ